MVARTEAYVDTSALIACADGSDTYHALFSRLFDNPPRLVTTSLVVSEGHAWFLRRFDRFRALQFLSILEQMPALTVLAVSPPEVARATTILRRFSDQNLTMTDAAGLDLMQARKIKSCWSTDFHMSLTGVPLAIH
jgi:predicted nucleic acid-binding protein